MGINNILAVAATCEQNNSKIVSKSHKMYGFWLRAATKGLWVIGYCGLMGFGAQIPIHRVGGMVLLWYLRGYGLSKVWFTRGSTVVRYAPPWPNIVLSRPVLFLSVCLWLSNPTVS